MEFLLKKIEQVLKIQKKWKIWQKIVAVLACFTVVVTTYALILPAITLNQDMADEKGGIVLEETEDIVQEETAAGNEVQAGQEQTENTEEVSPETTADVLEEITADSGQNASDEAAVLTGITYPESLNIRTERRKDAEVLETVPQGTNVTVLEDQGDGWLFVTTPDGQNGYVKKAYVLLPGETVEEKKPAMTFEMVADKDSPDAEISEAYINGTYSRPITVHVEAPVGAFPAGTTMKVRPIAEEQVREVVESVIPDSETVNRVSAVDISFIDVCGDEIEPDTEIKVSLTSEDIPADQESVVVHVDNEGQAQMVEAKTEEENVVFESDKFSVYVVVGTETLTTQYITAEGDTYSITVTYEPEAEIPEDAELIVSEIKDKEVYDRYFSQAEEALSDENDLVDIRAARFFDIEIRSKGEKFEPKIPVEVQIEHDTPIDINNDELLNIVHFADEGTEIITDVVLSNDKRTVTHNQNGFSVTGEIVAQISGTSWPNELADNEEYVIIVSPENSTNYYAVSSDGSLRMMQEGEFDLNTNEVVFTDLDEPDELAQYSWTYDNQNSSVHRLVSSINNQRSIYPYAAGVAIQNTNNSPTLAGGYIVRTANRVRYFITVDETTHQLSCTSVRNQGGSTPYPPPANAAKVYFATNFETDAHAYGTAGSVLLTGEEKILRLVEVTTEDGSQIDFENFTWRSSNSSIATVSVNEDANAPIAHAVAVGRTKIIGTRINSAGETEEVVWNITVKDVLSNSIVFLHQAQDRTAFIDNTRPIEVDGEIRYVTEHGSQDDNQLTNYVKFVVVLADENGQLKTVDNAPDPTIEGEYNIPDRYEFRLNSDGIFTITEDSFSGISVPGYSFSDLYAYFGWTGNTDMSAMPVATTFKNFGRISDNYASSQYGYFSVLGWSSDTGRYSTINDYGTSFPGVTDPNGNTYMAYHPTGTLIIVLKPVSDEVAYRTFYHNDYNPNGTAIRNIVDTTIAKMQHGEEWDMDTGKWKDWYGETIMTNLAESDLTSPADGYEFVGWFDNVDAEGNGTGNQIVGRTEDGDYYALKNGEKIIIRQNNDIYAKWQLARGTLTIEKEIVGDLTDAELAALKESLTFTVTNDNDSTDRVIKTGSDMTWDANKGSVDITGLSVATTYTVTESGSGVANYDVTTEIDGGTNITVSKTGARTVSVTNTYVKKTATIKIIKMESATIKKLPNATFNLYRPAAEDDTETTSIKVNNEDTQVVLVQRVDIGTSGEVEIEDLPVGLYYLVETKPPAGYELLTAVIGFELIEGGITLRSQDHVRSNGFELTVYNDSGAVLPSTGGPGTLLYTLSGIVLMLSAALMYGFRMRRRERRLN